MKAISLIILAAGISLLLVQNSCKKDNPTGNSTVTVKMKSDTAAYDKVLVEVTGLQVFTSASGWISINVKDTIYNLLQLTDTSTAVLLGSATVPVSDMQQLKLVLGTRDSIVVGGVIYPLTFTTGDAGTLTINAHQELIANRAYNLMLDFDAASSVVYNSVTYELKPAVSVKLIP